MTGCYAKNLYSTTVHIRFFEPFFFCEFSICRGGWWYEGKKKTDGQGAPRRQRISRVGDKKRTRADMLKSKRMKVQL